MSRIIGPLLAATGAVAVPALAQIPGLYSLPTTDFTWRWGQVQEARRQGPADLDIDGNEAQFRCNLTAGMRASSTMTPADYRKIEQDLASRLDFIYASSEAMNYLEQQFVLDWAVLDCKEFEPAEKTAEEKAAREQEARDKMLRELEKRRERQQRNAQ
jgi:hypothetical protein